VRRTAGGHETRIAGIAAKNTGLTFCSSTNYRTFTEPLARVKVATLTAFKRMAIDVESTQETKSGKVLRATTDDRQIEVELEAITPNATRMRSVAKQQGGFMLDSATGLGIGCRRRRC